MPMFDLEGQTASTFKLDMSSMARAYVNWGKWVADCPAGCGGAMALNPHQGLFHCGECQHMATLEWPNNVDEIWEALEERPFARIKNWFPPNHELAILSGEPHGQSAEELRQEARDHGLDGTQDVRS